MSEESTGSAGTIPVREGEGFDLEAVHEKLRAEIDELPEGDLDVRQFPSGASNLTYLLRVDGWEGVLRRPPFGPVPRRRTTWAARRAYSRA